MTAWICDARAITGLGDLDSTWRALQEKRTAIRAIKRFDTSPYSCKIGSWIEGLSPQRAGHSLLHSLLDRLLDKPVDLPPSVFVVTASTKGAIDNLEALLRGEAAEKGDILPSRLPGIVAEKLGLKGPGINVSAACASSTIALSQAAGLIESGITDAALVCCVDLLTEFVFSGFASLRILSPRPCRPFDKARNGLSLGEGAALFLLVRKETAMARGLKCRAVVSGWGVTNDAEHIVSPAADGRGLASAVHIALTKAATAQGQVGAISAHGTGTIQNDAMEARAFGAVFAKACPPVYSVKGAIGHAIGAAGGIEAALALKCLEEETVPPTVGFSTADPEIPLPVTSDAQAMNGRCVLVTNAGFGGVNCAIVLTRGNG